MDNRLSYIAANSFPAKVLQPEIVNSCALGRIPPVHVQLFPTNRCNQACSFCSCALRDDAELPLEKIRTAAKLLPSLGCRSVTVSGGGEPLCHPKINGILAALLSRGLQVGLVTNGIALDRLQTPVSWCRISASDERILDRTLSDEIEEAVHRWPDTDWAVSYVMQSRFDPENLRRHAALAKELGFTHVRVVTDMLDLEHATPMDQARDALSGNDDLVIYQDRCEFTRGQNPCYLSLLKPVLGADGYIYPCCGAQYAHDPQDLNLPPSMRMGKIEDFGRLTEPFDGSDCVRCYYRNYNDSLGLLRSELCHKAFV